jgi:hypothetical protein
MKYLNLGCARYRPTWTNIDMGPRGSGVIAQDLSADIPSPDASLEAIKASESLGG